MNIKRVRAISRKEFRGYRRNRFVVPHYGGVAACLRFPGRSSASLAVPVTASSGALDTNIGLSMLFVVLVPAVVAALVSALAVVGEREQGTLEPVLTHPGPQRRFPHR